MPMSPVEVPVPTLLQRSVILEPDRVRILDRRIFPHEIRFVDCLCVDDVALAIEQMVTQSSGPYFAAGAAMVLAARVAAAQSDPARRLQVLREAGARLVATRKTNNNIAQAVAGVLESAPADCESLEGPALAAAVEHRARAMWEQRRANSRLIGRHASTLLKDGDRILTHCWADAAFIECLAAATRDGKRLEVTCTETRPYLQGARLTAHSVAEMGLPVTVITDGMAAWAMDRGRVDVLLTAADRVTMSGHVVNKIGTLQLAIAAQAYRIPYYATVTLPDVNAPGPQAVPIEERDPEESLTCLGMRTATPLAQGWYPSFDVTPPSLVSAIVSRLGIHAPTALAAGMAAAA
jgi:methylthioribose-1-phosphate isomerase